ncbi:uncharacterized protein LOC110449210 [Mizuhopecten yessoensis]|uniref:uncharacterized protein LOC110449210 n=1 Tax=Mizuhopecten yessoensis TaxID=6573 RepID=UPI000B459325|nr:uncharacterized protein LOC110449210 [Mizuhopecten yessoensis]
MVQCAAINCNNSSNRGQKISLFAFPRDRKLGKLWVMKLKRGNFSPSDHSRLCERHFEEDCFTQDRRLLASIGFTPGRKSLKPGAIPTIFDFSSANIRKNTPGRSEDSCLGHLSTPNKNRTSTAIQKRRCLELLPDITSHNSLTSMYAASTHVQYHPNQVHMETHTSALDLTKTADKCVGPNDPLDTYNVGCQTSYNLTKRRHVSLQTRISEMKPTVMSCGVQATCQTTSASVQCHRYNHTQKKHTGSESDDESDMDISPPDQGHDSEWSPSQEDCSDLEGGETCNTSRQQLELVFV